MLSGYRNSWLILQIHASLNVLGKINPTLKFLMNLFLFFFFFFLLGVVKSINKLAENERLTWALQPAWLHDSKKTAIKQLIRS